MIKCTKGQVRRLKTALRWKIPPEQRQRIQMVLLRESGMTQPLIAAAIGVSLSTVNRAHMAYDHGGVEALKPRPSGGRKRENMTLEEEKALLALLGHEKLETTARDTRVATGMISAIQSPLDLLAEPRRIPDEPKPADAAEPPTLPRPCPCCGGRMLIIETFARGCEPKYRPAAAPLVIRIDTS